MSSEQPCKLNSMDVALDIAGVEKGSSENLQLQSTLEVIQFELVLNERSVSDGGNLCPLIDRWCRRLLIAAIQLTVSCSELYFFRCCALKRTGKYVS